MLLAVGGIRPCEGLSIRIKDFDLESKPTRDFVRGDTQKQEQIGLCF